MADQSTAKLAGLRGTGDISVVAKESEQSLTLRIPDEDHTLGNAIRYVLHRRYSLFCFNFTRTCMDGNCTL